MKFITVLLLGFTSFSIWAQNGPEIGCDNCEGLSAKPYPVAGNWYNPEQPGTGYIIDIQKGYLYGFYFGYDAEGNQRWMSFQGDLEESNNPLVRWELKSHFLSYTNGNAFNENYQVPEAVESEHEVHVEFLYRHYARIAVDDGEYQNIIPLNYKVESEKIFPESDFHLPDLTGLWTPTWYDSGYSSGDNLSHKFEGGRTVEIIKDSDEVSQDGTRIVTYVIFKDYSASSIFIERLGEIICKNPINHHTGQRIAYCHLDGWTAYISGDQNRNHLMSIPLGDLGAFRFSAEYVGPPGSPGGQMIVTFTRNDFFNWMIEDM